MVSPGAGDRGLGLARSEAEHVDRARARPDVAQAVPHRLRGDPLRRLGGTERVEAARELRSQGRRMRAARSMGGAAGMALAGQLDQPLTVEEDVDGLLAVAAGD